MSERSTCSNERGMSLDVIRNPTGEGGVTRWLIVDAEGITRGYRRSEYAARESVRRYEVEEKEGREHSFFL